MSVRTFHAFTEEGPVHRAQDAPHDNLAWCGVRRRFRHTPGPEDPDAVTCPTCLRRIDLGRPLSKGARS